MNNLYKQNSRTYKQKQEQRVAARSLNLGEKERKPIQSF